MYHKYIKLSKKKQLHAEHIAHRIAFVLSYLASFYEGGHLFWQCLCVGRPCKVVSTDPETHAPLVFKYVTAGQQHSMAVVEVASAMQPYQLYTWGCNRHGQLGLGDWNNRSQPARVKKLDRRVLMRDRGFELLRESFPVVFQKTSPRWLISAGSGVSSAMTAM